MKISVNCLVCPATGVCSEDFIYNGIQCKNFHNAMEKVFTSTNNARDEICPDCDGGVLAYGSMMERPCPKCRGTGKLSPVA